MRVVVALLWCCAVVAVASRPPCAPLPSPRPQRSPETCAREVAVLEHQPYHDEVLFTAVRLAQVAGADCVVVLKVATGYRQFDVFVEMRKWARVRVVHGYEKVRAYLASRAPRILVVDTFEEMSKRDVPTSRLLDLARVISSKVRVVAGCHNLAACLDMRAAVARAAPALVATPLVYHPAMAAALVSRELPPQWRRPIVSVPFFFGPDDHLESEGTRRGKVVKLLVVGSLSAGRRNYGVLADLAARGEAVELAVFGSGGSEASERLRGFMKNASSATNLAVSFHRGNYSTLFALARAAHFVAPLTDAATPTFRHYVQGKLSSALAVAIGFLVPVVGADSLLDALGLPGQITHPADGGGPAFAQAVSRAVALYDLDARAYADLKACICRFRADHFANATRRFRDLLFASPPR